jgi:hypothetical protein
MITPDPVEVARLTKKALEPLPELLSSDSKSLADTLTADDDPALGPLLRFHLLAEQLFNRLFLSSFRQPTHLEKFRFAQKLSIVRALGRVPDVAIEGMQRVNALRNQCAQVHAHRIALADIDRVGETIQPTYAELKAAHSTDLKLLTVWTLSKLYEPFLAATLTAELVAKVMSDDRP